MKSQIKNILKNNVCKSLSTFVFVFMFSCVIMPVHAFAASESISGKLTLELVSNGGDSIIPIDASTTSSTGAFSLLPVIFAIFALGLFVVLLYSLFTGRLKNKTLSIFALCLVVSVGICGTKTIIANAANGDESDNQGISSSAYLKFDEAGKVLENKLDITNSTDGTINIENIICDSEYASIFPDLAGVKITGNSSYEGKLKCDVVPASLIGKAKEAQGKAEIEGFFSVNFNKEEPVPTGEAYAYNDTSNNKDTTLVFAYDNEKSTHDAVYEIPDHPTQASSWAWDGERDLFTQVKINEEFKHYSGLTSTSYMFYNFKNASTIEGFENLNTSNVTNMACMFQSFGYMSTTLDSVPNVSDWNTSQVADVNSMFYNYGYSSKVLSSVPDVSKWNTSNVTSIYAMFYRYGYSSLSLNSAPDMSQWYTSKITDMSSMFFDYGYKSNLLQTSPNMSMDTSNVTNMSYMFYDYGYSSKALNEVPDVSSWNTSKVTDMSFMFYSYAQSSTSIEVVPEVKNWDTSNVENMSSMFYCFGGSSAKLNAVPDVSSWSTSNLTYITYMFNDYGKKSPLLNEAPKVEDWDTSNITSMTFLFAGYGENSSAINAVPNVSKWNTAQVTDMSYMFCNYASGVQIESLDISGFDTKSVTNCNRMLSGLKLKSITLGINFNLDLSTSEGHLTNSTGVQDATWYDMEGVGYEKCCMGRGAREDVTTYYDTNPSPTLAEAYAYKDTANEELATLVLAYDNAKSSHTDKGQTIYTIPTDATDKKSWGWDDERIAFKKIKINIKFKYYTGTNSTACMFANFENVKEFEGFENLNTSNVTNMLSTFAGFNYSSKDFDVVPDTSSWDTSKVTNMSYMFYGYGYSSSSLNTTPDISNWNTTDVKDMSCMFSGYGHDSNTLNSVPDVSNWDVSNTSDISYMFYTYGYTSNVLNKVPDTSNWKTTSLTNVSSMFRSYGYTSSVLTVVPAVSKWDTSKTTDMSYTFYAYGYTSTSLSTAPDVQGWNTPFVKDISCMFTDYGSQSVISELNLSCFNTATATSFSRMLSGVKLKSIILGTNFNLDLTTSGANLTNSKGDTNATWYSGATPYENCSMGTEKRSVVTTYYDHDSREAYGYKDTTESGITTLVITYDNEKSTHKNTYDIPDSVTYPSDWKWDADRETFKKVVIDGDFRNFHGLTSTSYMFVSFTAAESIEGAVNIDTSNVKDMTEMFADYGKNSTTLNTVPNVTDWNTSNVTNMLGLFASYGYSSTSLNVVPYVSKWNISNVTNMSYMFSYYGYSSTGLNAVPDVSSWNKSPSSTSSITDMSYMFNCYGESSRLNAVPDVTDWNTLNVTNMSYMFNNYASTALSVLPNVAGWQTPKVEDVSYMFAHSDGSKETSGTFESLYLSNFNTSQVKHSSNFLSNRKLKSITLGKDFSLDLTSSNAGLTNSSGVQDATWYSGTTAYENCSMGTEKRSVVTTYIDTPSEAYGYLDGTILVLKYDTQKSTHKNSYDIPESATAEDKWDWNNIRGDITKVTIDSSFNNYSGLKSTAYMFSSFTWLTETEGFDNLNTTNVTNMSYMFNSCSSIESLSLNLDFTNTTNMNYMFNGCENLTLDCSKWNVKSDCSHEGFYDCALGVTPPSVWPTEAYGYLDGTTLVLNYDIGKIYHGTTYDIPTEATSKESWLWDGSRTTITKVKIDARFKNYSGLKSTAYMFSSFTSLAETEGLENLNTPNVTNMSYMFNGCSSIETLSLNLDFTNTTNMNYMFNGCENLTLDCSKWNVKSDCSHEGFYDSALGVTPPSVWLTEAYGYLDGTTLVLNYDIGKIYHGTTYDIPTDATAKESWGWDGSRTTIKLVKIDTRFKNYSGLKSTAYMFYNFTAAESIEGAENIDTSNVENMTEMFSAYGTNSTTLNTVPNVTDWNTSNVTNMEGLFASYGYSSTSLNVVPDVSKWNSPQSSTSSVINMSQMFENYGCSSTVLSTPPDVSLWYTTNVENMSYMFYNFGYSSSALNTPPDVSKWTTSNVTDMSFMFCNFGQNNVFDCLDLSNFSTNNDANITSMIHYMKLKSITLGTGWNKNLSSTGACLTNSSGVQNATWYVGTTPYEKCGMGTLERNVATTYNDQTPEAYGYLDDTTLVLKYDTKKASHGTETFDIPKEVTAARSWGWDIYRDQIKKVTIDASFKNYSGLTSTAYMFYHFDIAESIEGAENIDTSNVKDMTVMFSAYGMYSTSLNTVPNVTDWNTSNVKNMEGLFAWYGLSSTSLTAVPNVLNWNTSNVTKLASMFRKYGYKSSNLNSVPTMTKWNTAAVEDMDYMFLSYGDNSSFDCLDLSSFNTGKVTESREMLNGMKLSSISLGTEFSLDLTTSGAYLTNSTGKTDATWYDGTTAYENCSMGTEKRSVATTYTDTMPSVSSGTNENTLTNDTSINQDSDNISNIQDVQKASTLNRETNQDKPSSTDTDTKDKATENNTEDKGTEQTDTKAEEVETNFSVLLNFTTSISSFFNSFKLPFV